jgi:sialic acid synthase SpsE
VEPEVRVRIGEREIVASVVGVGLPYVIAEIGVNHDGSAEKAIELVDAAARAEADAVKFQLFDADLLMSRASKLAAYQKSAGETDPLAMLRRLQLPLDAMRPIIDHAHSRGVHAIVTVFSESLVAPAAALAWDAFKTASPDIIHLPLLRALEATGEPLILSTGASTLDEVSRAIAWLTGARQRLAVLQCVSSYPAPLASAELGGIAAIAGVFHGPVGYSDHTPDVETGALAVQHGACILEKHFTHSRAAIGPDHAASLEEADLARYVALARAAAGTRPEKPLVAEKRVLPIEEDVRRVSRQSIVTTRAVAAGERLTGADLTCKRPGTGIPPFELDAVVGKPLARAVEGDTPLQWSDLAEPLR